MRLADVSPVTEVGRAYAAQLNAAMEQSRTEHSDESLRAFCRQWSQLAPDALAQVEAADFSIEHFRDAMEMERRGRFSGEDAARRFGAILMPTNLMDAQLVAMRFHVPDGLALLRLVEAKRLVMVNGSLQRNQEIDQ